MARTSLLSVALVMAFTFGGTALAADPLDPDAVLQKATPARFIMGFKAGGGGSLWTEPDDTTLHTFQTGQRQGESFSLPLFDETRGGYTISAGFFVQGVFFENLGLEVGANFVQHSLLEKIDWSYVETITQGGTTTSQTFEAKSEQVLRWTALHVPILVKAIIPSGKTRISLGVGPEFSFGSWSHTEFEITESDTMDANGDLVLAGSRGAFKSLKSKLEDSIYLSVVFGIEIVAGDFLIPIDIHWSYNFSQETDYRGRAGEITGVPDDANQDLHPEELTLKTRDTMYGGLRIGIAYQFD